MSLGNESDPVAEDGKISGYLFTLQERKDSAFQAGAGPAVYCKDCIAKIKSGEIKVEKKPRPNQIRRVQIF